MFSLYPLKLSEGKKGKFWKFEKSFGSEHVSPLFFLAFGAAAVANCYLATLCLAEQYICLFCSKTSRSYSPEFSFLAFWKFEKSFSLEHVSLLFFLLLLSLPSRHIMLCKTEEYICVFCSKISNYYSPEFLWLRGKKKHSESSIRASAQNMSVHFFFLTFGAADIVNCYLHAMLYLAEQKNTLLHFVQKYIEITSWSFQFWHFSLVNETVDLLLYSSIQLFDPRVRQWIGFYLIL